MQELGPNDPHAPAGTEPTARNVSEATHHQLSRREKGAAQPLEPGPWAGPQWPTSFVIQEKPTDTYLPLLG